MKKSIIIVDDALEDTDSLDYLYERVVSNTLPPEEIIHKSELGDYKCPFDKTLKKTISSLWEECAPELYRQATYDGIQFFEAWCNSYYDPYHNQPQDKSGLPYHIDKDEDLYLSTKKISTPSYASLIYLGPKSSISGGDLYINTEGLCHFKKFEENGSKELDLNSPDWIKIKFKYNRFVIFDGSFPHLVSPVINHSPNQPRVGLAINLWDRKISC